MNWMTGTFDNFLYLVNVLSTGLLSVFSVKNMKCPVYFLRSY